MVYSTIQEFASNLTYPDSPLLQSAPLRNPEWTQEICFDLGLWVAEIGNSGFQDEDGNIVVIAYYMSNKYAHSQRAITG